MACFNLSILKVFTYFSLLFFLNFNSYKIPKSEKLGAPDKPCGVGCADVNPKTVAKRYMIVQKVVSLHYESEWQ